MSEYTLHLGDCLEVMKGLPDNSVDAIVTDPPYGLGFMGKHWDHGVPGVEFWVQALRLLKPGGHLLAFGGTRTYHRMAVAIEDAGFEIRDQIQWLYGSGFPKSLDVSKAIDAAAGAEREVVHSVYRGERAGRSAGIMGKPVPRVDTITAPATPDAERWAGWGTALKPANEPICMARKPLAGTVAANVLAWGTGAINVDGCRVGTDEIVTHGKRNVTGNSLEWSKTTSPDGWQGGTSTGRWPANVIHDGSEEVVGLFPVTGPSKAANRGVALSGAGTHEGWKRTAHLSYEPGVRGHDDAGGSAARFFYCAKASPSERDAGLEGMERRKVLTMNSYVMPSEGRTADKNGGPKRNHHPTVKPLALMRYLCRLITPPGGVVLDPFMGSGSTGCGAVLEGLRFVGIEREAEYLEIAQRRIEYWAASVRLPLLAMAAD